MSRKQRQKQRPQNARLRWLGWAFQLAMVGAIVWLLNDVVASFRGSTAIANSPPIAEVDFTELEGEFPRMPFSGSGNWQVPGSEFSLSVESVETDQLRQSLNDIPIAPKDARAEALSAIAKNLPLLSTTESVVIRGRDSSSFQVRFYYRKGTSDHGNVIPFAAKLAFQSDEQMWKVISVVAKSQPVRQANRVAADRSNLRPPTLLPLPSGSNCVAKRSDEFGELQAVMAEVTSSSSALVSYWQGKNWDVKQIADGGSHSLYLCRKQFNCVQVQMLKPNANGSSLLVLDNLTTDANSRR
jgi:hypothetical protein